MFVRILADCECKHKFWHDTHSLDCYKEDAWVEVVRTEILKAGHVFSAVRVRPSKNRAGYCIIDVNYSQDEPERYSSIPYGSIEIIEGKPEPAEHR